MSSTQAMVKSITDILTEAKAPAPHNRPGITMDDINVFKKLLELGYETPRIRWICEDPSFLSMVHIDRIAQVAMDEDTIWMLEKALKENFTKGGSASTIGTAKNVVDAAKASFRSEFIDGIAMLKANTVAIYRHGVAEASILTFSRPEVAEEFYQRTEEAMRSTRH